MATHGSAVDPTALLRRSRTASRERLDLPSRLMLLLIVVTGAGVLLSALFLPTAIAASDAVDAFETKWLDIPPLPEDFEEAPENSVILASDGSELAVLHGEQNRVTVRLSDIPLVTRNAVIATEDANFWTHNGVNHQAILRALLTNVRSGSIEQGGSTITQQYVKLKLLTNERTLDRKLREVVWAVELEDRLSKEEILESYLNTAYFGDGVYGIGTAARYFFSKPVTELDLRESALLAGLIRSPERNNPLSAPKAARARRSIVLEQMRAEGYITGAQMRAVRKTGLGLNVAPPVDPVVPFFIEWVKQVLAKDAVDLQPAAQAVLGDEQADRYRQLFEGGLVIHTTLDPRLQQLADTTVRTYLSDPVTDPLGALVTIAPDSGAVVALAVGPKQFGECEGGVGTCDVTKVNPAVPGGGGSGREPGSAFKPLLITAALENRFSPGWSVDTRGGQPIPGCDTNGEPWKPQNYSDGGGGGLMNMYEAIKASNNVYHAKLTKEVGVENVKETAAKLGIKHAPNWDTFGSSGCSIGLGTATLFPLEMASSFATLANRGTYCAPFAIERIEDRSGNLLFQQSPQCEQVIDSGIADRVTDIIQGPPTPGGTAGYITPQLGRPVAGKTGTTDDWDNAWFVGYVPQYATAAWVGFEIPRSMFNVEANGVTYENVTGGSIPGHMWADYMQAALEGVEVETFPTPPPVPVTTVPNVVGQHEETAEDILEDKELLSTSTTTTDWRPAGTVIAQTPAPGSEVWLGSAVHLTVSDGTATPPPVPHVQGMDESEARAELEGAGYVVEIVDQRVDDPRLDKIVLDQTPEGGEPLAPGETVSIVVGKYKERGKPPDETEEPSEQPTDETTAPTDDG